MDVMQPLRWGYRRRDVVVMLGLALGYGAVIRGSLAFFSVDGIVSEIYPTIGVSLAVVLIGGPRFWPGIFLGELFGNLLSGVPVGPAVGLTVVDTVEPLLACWLLCRHTRFRVGLEKGSDFLRLAAVGGLCAGLAALAGSAVLWLGGLTTPPHTYLSSVLTWWRGEFLGLLLVTPTILVWRTPARGWFGWPRALETVGGFGLAFLVGQMLFLGWSTGALEAAHGDDWPFLFVAWAAIRRGRHGVQLLVMMFATQALFGAVHSMGIFGNDLAGDRMLALGAYIGMLASIGILLSLAIHDRDRASEALLQGEERFRKVVEAFPSGVLLVDATGHIRMANRCLSEQFGYTGEELLGQPVELLVPREAREAHVADRERYQDAQQSRVMGRGRALQGARKDGSLFPVEVGLQPLMLSGSLVTLATVVDTTSRRESEEALRASEARLREGQAVAQVGSWELDLVGNHLQWSDQIFRIFEVDQALFGASYEAFLAAIHPEDREAVNDAYTRSLANRAPYEITHRLQMPDGRIKWVHERCQSDFDAEGRPIRSVGTVQDITARKLAEDKVEAALREKEVLLKEIYHRVKNNLQVVASLLTLQGRMIPDESFRAVLEESAGRVKSMAMVHEQLYRSRDLANIEMKEYLRQLAEHLMAGHEPRSLDVPIRLELEEISLGIETAVPLGLIMNELISNAYKHAFLNGAKGEIVLTTGREAGGRVRVRLADSGRGLPEGFAPNRSETLGMRLVVTLASQLDARLTWGTEGGAWFELNFLPDAPEADRLLV